MSTASPVPPTNSPSPPNTASVPDNPRVETSFVVVAQEPRRAPLPVDKPHDGNRHRPIAARAALDPQPSARTRAEARLAAPEPAENMPVIRVSIGRIDVHAASAPARPSPPQSAPRTPRLTLDEYLRARNEGSR
jgi:hypothetical protein